MTNMERDGLRKLLEKIAGELETSQLLGETRAAELSAEPRDRLAFEVGWLGQQCKGSAYSVRKAIEAYLTPRRARGRKAA